MLLVLLLCVLAATVAAWRHGGPLLGLLIAWLVSLTPAAIGLIQYDYLAYESATYVWVIGASILAFCVGAGAARIIHRPPSQDAVRPAPVSLSSDYATWLPIANVCAGIAFVAIAALLFNIFTSGIAVSDLEVVREQQLNATSGNLAVRIASVTTWASFVCFIFALLFRGQMERWRLALFLLASTGMLLAALSTAGRQAVFQVILISIFVEAIRRRSVDEPITSKGRVLRTTIVTLAAAYLMYVTMNRTTAGFAESKAALLLRLFDAHVDPMLDEFLRLLGGGARDIAVEAMLYVSHTAPLFAVFLDVDFGARYWGLHNFPFVFRQIEGLTGVSVLDAMSEKALYIGAEGVIGVGWNTALSSVILDFGLIGMPLFVALQGYITEWSVMKVENGGGFPFIVICVVMWMAAVYLPFLPAISDTSIFLLLVFAAVLAATGRARTAVKPVGASSA